MTEEWRNFEYNYAGNLEDSFEKLCQEFMQIIEKDITLKPYNCVGCETEPYNGKSAYQSKCCVTARLVSGKSVEIQKGIEKAKQKYPDINKFYIFVYPCFSEGSNAKANITSCCDKLGIEPVFYDRTKLLEEIKNNDKYSGVYDKFLRLKIRESMYFSYSSVKPNTEYFILRTLYKDNIEEDIETIMGNYKYIVIKNSAGLGKTEFLKHLCMKYDNNGKFSTYYISLKNYKANSLYQKLSNNYSKCWFFLDGYDELDKESQNNLKKEINDIIENDDNVSIIITSRYSVDINNKFSEYELKVFDEQNIEKVCSEFLKSDSNHFIVMSKEKDMYKYYYNPFYLSQVIKYYIDKKDIPDKTSIFEQLFNNQYEQDKDKLNGVDRETLKENLSKIAFELSCDLKSNFQFDHDFINFGWLKFDSESESCEFVHNNFKEYLAACYLENLNYDEIIGIATRKITDKYFVYPKFRNVFAHLYDITKKKDIKDFIKDNALYLIVDSDQLITVDYNYINIIREIFQIIIDKKSWLDSNYDRQKISKICDLNCVDYLISLLDFKNHRTTICESLTILSRVNYDEKIMLKIKEKVISLLDDKEECLKDKYVCSCLINIFSYIKINVEQMKSIINDYFNVNSTVRASIYSAINHSDLQCQFFDNIMDGLKYLNMSESWSRGKEEEDDIYNISEGMNFEECIKNITCKETALRVLDLASNDLKEHHYINLHISNCLFSIGNNFDDEEIEYKIYELIIHNSKKYNRFENGDLRKYLCDDNKKMKFFSYIMKTDLKSFEKLNLISQFANEEIMTEVIGFFRVNEEYESYSHYFISSLKANNCNSGVFDELLSRHYIILKEQEDDFEKQRSEKKQEEFNILFDNDPFKNQCIDLARKFNQQEQPFYRFCREEKVPTFFKNLYDGDVEHIDETKFDSINWKLYAVSQMSYYVSNYKKLISLSNAQLNYISKWITDNYTEIDFKKSIEYKGQKSIFYKTVSLYAYDFLMELDLNVDNSYLEDALWFVKIGGIEENIQKIANKIGEDRTVELIIERIKSNTIKNYYELGELIKFVSKYKKYEIDEEVEYNLLTVPYDETTEYFFCILIDYLIETKNNQIIINNWGKLDKKIKLYYLESLKQLSDEDLKFLIELIEVKDEYTIRFADLGLEHSLDNAFVYYINWIKENDSFYNTMWTRLKMVKDISKVNYIYELLELAYKYNSNIDYDSPINIMYQVIENIGMEIIKKQKIEDFENFIENLKKIIKKHEEKYPSVTYLNYFIDKLINSMINELQQQMC